MTRRRWCRDMATQLEPSCFWPVHMGSHFRVHTLRSSLTGPASCHLPGTLLLTRFTPNPLVVHMPPTARHLLPLQAPPTQQDAGDASPSSAGARLRAVATMWTSPHSIRPDVTRVADDKRFCIACDVWALCVIAYFTLFGAWPFPKAVIGAWVEIAADEWRCDKDVKYLSACRSPETTLPPLLARMQHRCLVTAAKSGHVPDSPVPVCRVSLHLFVHTNDTLHPFTRTHACLYGVHWGLLID